MAQVKICGLSTPEAIEAAAGAGASHVGLVHFEPSPRHLELRKAAELRRCVPTGIKAVLVTVNLPPEQLARAVDAVRPDVLQFHGGETPEWIRLVRDNLKIECWRAIGLRDSETLAGSRRFAGACDRLLFDAPANALPGGNGTSFQWDLLQRFEHRMDWALAGGLDAGNVAEAIARTNAPLVDASSGLESAPGVKDLDAIRAFCAEAAR